jgi:hypothetical protein
MDSDTSKNNPTREEQIATIQEKLKTASSREIPALTRQLGILTGVIETYKKSKPKPKPENNRQSWLARKEQ